MRLLNAPLRDQMNNALNGNASLAGMDQPGYVPYSGAIDPRQSVMIAQSHELRGALGVAKRQGDGVIGQGRAAGEPERLAGLRGEPQAERQIHAAYLAGRPPGCKPAR
jgi:hypothetical protein